MSGLSDSDKSDVYDDGLLLLEEQNKEMSESVSLPTLVIAGKNHVPTCCISALYVIIYCLARAQ